MSDSQSAKKPRRSQKVTGGSRQIMIRLSPEAFNELKTSAEKESRSLANMVVYRYELGRKINN